MIQPLLIQGMEWIIIILIVVVLLVWGPEKIPKLARSLGEAKKEFTKAQKEMEEAVKEPPPGDPILEAAKKLGITTEGKTKEQIKKEIAEKISKEEK
jgi:sec-independent protein translocase protein TatA